MTAGVVATDSDLVARARRGDQEAFAVLVTRYQRPLMARALRSTRHLEDADDLVQETFLRAWRSLGGFRSDDRFGGWLFRILANLAADRGRIRGREAPGGDEVGQEIADDLPSIEETLLAEEIAGAAKAALEQMPDGRRREIFQMRFVEDMPIQEIAQRLGLHSGTIKVHLFRGIRELRRRLERWDGTS